MLWEVKLRQMVSLPRLMVSWSLELTGDSFGDDYGASLQEQQVCRGMRCIDQCEVADLDELATVDFRSQSKSERGTLGMDQCGQLTRDRRMNLEVAESSAQLEIGNFSICIGGQRQKSRDWLLGQKK